MREIGIAGDRRSVLIEGFPRGEPTGIERTEVKRIRAYRCRDRITPAGTPTPTGRPGQVESTDLSRTLDLR